MSPTLSFLGVGEWDYGEATSAAAAAFHSTAGSVVRVTKGAVVRWKA